jgi:hypothetical protein
MNEPGSYSVMAGLLEVGAWVMANEFDAVIDGTVVCGGCLVSCRCCRC